MSEQYVVVFTESVRHNPYKVTRGVMGPYTYEDAEDVARGQMNGEVFKLGPTGCPGCGHPECTFWLRGEKE